MNTFPKLLICFLAFTAAPMVSDGKVQTETCTLGDQRYLIGETWHPKLLPFGENSCVNCTCVTGGNVKCSGVDCPKPECKEPKIVRGQCCPTCDVRMEDKRIDVTDQPGCEFHGSHYEDGDIFPSNKTALKPKHSNQCVLCACYRGHVICHLKTCLSTLTCQKTMKVDDDCCLQCEQAPSLEDFTKLISDNMNHTLEEGDCLLTTGRQRNGTTWKPVIGQYGEMKCIICACINGQINCGRLQCPEHSDVKCDSSKVDPTGCCKQCTQKSKQKTQTENEEDKCLQTTSDNNQQKKHCMGKLKPSRNKRNRKKNVTENGRVLFQAEMHLNEVLHKLCIGDKSRHLVYHTRTNHFEALAIDLRNEQKIEQIYWTIRKGKFQTTERKYVLDPEEYRRNITVGDILGTVQKKDVKGFLRRLDKAQQKCKRKCKRKMLDKAIKRLRVQDVDLTKSCDVSPSVH